MFFVTNDADAAEVLTIEEVEAMRGRKVEVFHPQVQAYARRTAPPVAVAEPEPAGAEATPEEQGSDVG